jgi:hypothetical protein
MKILSIKEMFFLVFPWRFENRDKVTVSHYGISKEYYNYINILVSISEEMAVVLFNLLLLLLEEI